MYSLNKYSSISAGFGPEIYMLLFSERTQRKRKMTDVQYFSTLFEVSLWDRMNKSTIFIQLRITYLFLLSLFFPRPLISSLSYLSSLSSSAPVYLTVCSSLSAHRQASLTVHETAAGARRRACESVYIGIWYVIWGNNKPRCDTAWIISSGKTHTGRPGHFIFYWNDKSSQCEVWSMWGQTVYHELGFHQYFSNQF